MRPTPRPETRERILEAAADAFSRRGFKAATVREICSQADANVALLNYYFNGKELLYQEVIKSLFDKAFSAFPIEMKDEKDTAPEIRLAAYIRVVLMRLLSQRGLGGYHGKGKLLAREIADPSPAMDQVVEAHIKQQKNYLGSLISEILGPDATREDVLRCAMSVIGQCSHYAIARPILDRLEVNPQREDEAIEQLAEHVARFSLGGLRATREHIQARTKDGDPQRQPSQC